MALLIGIALDKGQIGSIDDKVLDYFPDYKVKRISMCQYTSDNWTYASLGFLGGRKGLTEEFK